MAYMRRVRVGHTIRLSNVDSEVQIRVAEVHKGRVVLAIIDPTATEERRIQVDTVVDVAAENEATPDSGQVLDPAGVAMIPEPPLPGTVLHYQFRAHGCVCGDRWPHE